MNGFSDELRDRLTKFREAMPTADESIAISLKLRADGGCFHRSCSPRAYELIDRYLASAPGRDFTFVLEEHESGPEILAYVVGGLGLSKVILDLVVFILKARAEGAHRGDRRQASLEVIVRRFDSQSGVLEERVVRVDPSEVPESKELAKHFAKDISKITSQSSDREKR